MRKKVIKHELSVGLSDELSTLLDFASTNSGIPPSILARVAITQRLVQEGWHKIFAAQQQTPKAS